MLILNDGYTHSYSSGAEAGVEVSANTTATFSGTFASTGPNAVVSWPPATFADAESGIAAIDVEGHSFVTIDGGTYQGGNGAPGVADEGDRVSDYQRPEYGPAPAFHCNQSSLTINGGTAQGGSYDAGATGSTPTEGAPAVVAYQPTYFGLTAGTLTGGTSESTLEGAPALRLALDLATDSEISGGTIHGGSGASTGASLELANRGAGRFNISGGIWTGDININLDPGMGPLRFVWGSGAKSLTTTHVAGYLLDGNFIDLDIHNFGGPVTVGSDSSSHWLQP